MRTQRVAVHGATFQWLHHIILWLLGLAWERRGAGKFQDLASPRVATPSPESVVLLGFECARKESPCTEPHFNGCTT